MRAAKKGTKKEMGKLERNWEGEGVEGGAGSPGELG